MLTSGKENGGDAGIDVYPAEEEEEKERCECSRGRLKSQSNALEPQSHNPTSKATVIKVWCLHNVLLLANYLEFKSTLTGLMTLANRTTATR
ncbi:hypothetical protein ALC57_01300 [Trachymyrmex cornetzi]|uniref:Uncharacterized protein n=1 Tax=Trachymyrmex cornetzi TaxID=471704 RepID=A0A195ELT3_9HYME|nr:hypothetical protein ALC57_01300 [Trachymyrmex cornetzi]